MPGIFFRKGPIFLEGREVTFVGRLRALFEAYSTNVEWLFQYCGRAGPGSNGYKTLQAGFGIPVECFESGLRVAWIISKNSDFSCLNLTRAMLMRKMVA